MKNLFIILTLILFLVTCGSQKIDTADELNEHILDGWNTWDNRSILTHVLLPEGLALTVQIHDTLKGDSLVQAFTGNRVKGSEKVRTLAHTPDGSYTDFVMHWREFGMRVQSISQDDDLSLLVTPLDTCANPGYAKLTAGMPYGNSGEITAKDARILAELGDKKITVSAVTQTGQLVQLLNQPVAFSTKPGIGLSEIQRQIQQAENDYVQQESKYGKYSETWDAIQNAMNWLVVYDPEKKRAITPVARPWAYGWGNGKPGGYILFCWDNFFAAYMHSINSKELAFNEAIQMCREIDDLGFVPNFSSVGDLKSRDRSQPPVGSMMVLEVYRRYPEKWFLNEVFDRLLTWNRWWQENRDQDGYLCWGSNPYDPRFDDRREMVQNEFKAASFESGLDNTPMYDGVPFDTTTHLMQLADVGLMGMYIGDCEALAGMAEILGRTDAAKELRDHAEKYRAKLKTMWDDDFGLFLNKRLDTGELSRRISPTNFYALIGKAATQEQAKRMIKEHFYNPQEFWGEWIMPSTARNDTAYTGKDYWRGSIWAPMNFLVYRGMRNYDLPQARQDLAEKSNALLMKQWLEKGYIRENYHAETGGYPGSRSDHFYHWGALLGVIALLENGYL